MVIIYTYPFSKKSTLFLSNMTCQINPETIKSTWNPSSEKEIKYFYQHIFPQIANKNPEYLNPKNISEFGFAPLRPISTNRGTRDFLRRTNTSISNIKDLQAICLNIKEKDPIKSVLENVQFKGIYFKLNNIKNHGWLLAFDIDAKNIAKSGLCPFHSGYENSTDSEISLIQSLPPYQYLYCFNCLLLSIQYAFDLKNILIEWGFNKNSIHILYSGQGTHIHVTDPISWNLGTTSREYIKTTLIQKYQIPLDPTVTNDANRVLRYPGSLNASVTKPVSLITEEEPIKAFYRVLENAEPRIATSSYI